MIRPPVVFAHVNIRAPDEVNIQTGDDTMVVSPSASQAVVHWTGTMTKSSF